MRDNPYAPERDYWDSLDPVALQWMKEFTKATTYGNKVTLQELCDAAGSKKYDQIKAEVSYERDYYKRATFILTKSRYCEEDYCWAVLRQEAASEAWSDENETDYFTPTKSRRKRKSK